MHITVEDLHGNVLGVPVHDPERDITPDVVQPAAEPMTADDYLRVNETAGTWGKGNARYEITEDADGNVTGITGGEPVPVYRAPSVVSLAELAAVGLTRHDVPNLIILEDLKNKETRND